MKCTLKANRRSRIARKASFASVLWWPSCFNNLVSMNTLHNFLCGWQTNLPTRLSSRPCALSRLPTSILSCSSSASSVISWLWQDRHTSVWGRGTLRTTPSTALRSCTPSTRLVKVGIRSNSNCIASLAQTVRLLMVTLTSRFNFSAIYSYYPTNLMMLTSSDSAWLPHFKPSVNSNKREKRTQAKDRVAAISAT